MPRQHLVQTYGDYRVVIDADFDNSRISKSAPCLRFSDASDTMHGILSNKKVRYAADFLFNLDAS